jgi:CDK inhibitor PHO81
VLSSPIQINAFYLQKEAELKLRLATLLSKRKAAAFRKRVETDDSNADVDGAEWLAVEEGFRLLQRDLSKLQVRTRTCAVVSSC